MVASKKGHSHMGVSWFAPWLVFVDTKRKPRIGDITDTIQPHVRFLVLSIVTRLMMVEVRQLFWGSQNLAQS